MDKASLIIWCTALFLALMLSAFTALNPIKVELHDDAVALAVGIMLGMGYSGVITVCWRK